MKILKVTFANINSLMGEWCIDFTTQQYSDDGIFAITGPTGAGKSSILDAISLGLYGVTPRIKSISAKQNEVMSRQADFCFSKVHFEVNGKIYCAEWDQKRTKKAASPFQSAKQSISILDGDEFKNIADSIKTCKTKIIEITGMTIDQFLQSILLAQGKFAAFLNADSSVRAAILEKITGTDVYSKISKNVFEKHKFEKEKLTKLQDKMEGFELLSDEEALALLTNITKRKTAIKTEEKQLLSLRASLQSYQTINDTNEKLAVFALQKIKNNDALENFKETRQKLQLANSALELDSDYSKLKTAVKSQQENDLLLQTAQGKRAAFHADLNAKATQFEMSSTVLSGLEIKQASEKKLIDKVKELDAEISYINQTVATLKADNKMLSGNIKTAESALQKVKKEIVSLNQDQQQVIEYQKKNSQDAQLTNDLGAIESGFVSMKATIEKIETETKLVKKLEKELLETQRKKTALLAKQQGLIEEQGQFEKQLGEDKTKLNDLLDGLLLREIKKNLTERRNERLLREKIASYEADRLKLEDGKACSLCGSLDHPFALGNVPQVDELVKTIISLEEQLEEIGKCDTHILATNSNIEKHILLLNANQQAITECDARNDELLTEQKAQQGTLLEMKNNEQASEKQLLASLQPYDIFALSDAKKILTFLKERRITWQSNEQKNRTFALKNSELQGDEKVLSEKKNELLKNLKNKEKTLEEKQLQCASLNKERVTLFGVKSVIDEETKAGKTLKVATQSKEKAQKDNHQAVTALAKNESEINTLKKQLSQSVETLKVVSKDWGNVISASDFDSEALYLTHRQPTETREKWHKQQANLDTNSAQIETQIALLQTLLKSEQLKEKVEFLEAELPDKIIQREAFKGELQSENGAEQEKWDNNNTLKTKFATLQTDIERHKLLIVPWEKLNELIGQKDGAKFQKFAQGLTFEIMVHHANEQLSKMSDRYLLQRDNLEPLKLKIIDQYQAGEIRSTENLSGGESFIVSLALALGLSKMASDKVSVGSLFLDEGFGTLDETALDTALNTLSSLHQEGKLIGIISHVKMLKDRITTQIEVSTNNDGTSRLSGPGVVGK